MHAVEAVEEVDVDGRREQQRRQVHAPDEVEQVEERNRAQHVDCVELLQAAPVLNVSNNFITSFSCEFRCSNNLLHSLF